MHEAFDTLQSVFESAKDRFQKAVVKSRTHHGALLEQHRAAHQELLHALAPTFSHDIDKGALILGLPELTFEKLNAKRERDRSQFLSNLIKYSDDDIARTQIELEDHRETRNENRVHIKTLQDAIRVFESAADFMSLLSFDQNTPMFRMSSFRRKQLTKSVAKRLGHPSFELARREYLRLKAALKQLRDDDVKIAAQLAGLSLAAREIAEANEGLDRLELDALGDVHRRFGKRIMSLSPSEKMGLENDEHFGARAAIVTAIEKKRIYLEAIDDHLLKQALVRIPDLERDLALARMGESGPLNRLGKTEEGLNAYAEKIEKQTRTRISHHETLSMAIVCFCAYELRPICWWDAMCSHIDQGNFVDDVIASRMRREQTLSRERLQLKETPNRRASENAAFEFERRLKEAERIPSPIDLGEYEA